jgi:RNA polymerase sigma-70 factor (ECF subfamily)
MERDVFNGFRAGRRDVLELIYRHNRCEVVVLVRLWLRRAGQLSDANVADLVQDVFAKAFAENARRAYDGVRPYGPFLARIARNTVVDWLRARRRERRADVDFLLVADSATSTLEPPLFPSHLLAVTQQFVSTLPSDLRGVHEYRFHADESQMRAARALGLSRQQLRTLERRLLAGLRRHLRDAAVGSDHTQPRLRGARQATSGRQIATKPE